MADEKDNSELRVEDRRHFDKEGNPVKNEETRTEEAVPPEKPSEFEETSSQAPQIDFPSLIFIYVQSALVHLGEVEDPISRKKSSNLSAARQMIDILELLQEKTRGNLTTQEEQYIEKALFDLRLIYVQKARQS